MFIRLITVIFIGIFFFAFFGEDGIRNYPFLSASFFTLIISITFLLQSFPGKYFNPIKFVAYSLWLIREIISSSWQVTKIIWTPSISIKPRIIEIDTELKPASAALVVLANSITLTPGTYTIDINEDKLLVHALTTANIRDITPGNELQSNVKKYFDLA